MIRRFIDIKLLTFYLHISFGVFRNRIAVKNTEFFSLFRLHFNTETAAFKGGHDGFCPEAVSLRLFSQPVSVFGAEADLHRLSGLVLPGLIFSVFSAAFFGISEI